MSETIVGGIRMDSYTSGIVVGMTNIPACTIQRYVRDFGSFFSETAQQKHRGRRYLPDDVRTILMIRHLYNERTPKQKIIAALSGEWSPPAMPRYDIDDASKIIAGARDILLETKKYSKRADAQVSRATYATSYLYEIHKRLEKRISKIEDDIKHLKIKSRY